MLLRTILYYSMSLVSLLGFQGSKDYRCEDLNNKFQKLITKNYSLEIPKGWNVTPETPWGAREIMPSSKESGEMGVMTAGPTQAPWDELYKTSLWFINREMKGTATPYKVAKNKSGFETCSWQMLNTSGVVVRRYVMIRHSDGRVIALSVKLPAKVSATTTEGLFTHMVDSATFASNR